MNGAQITRNHNFMYIQASVDRIRKEKTISSDESEELMDHPAIARAVAEHCPECFIYLSQRMRGDKSILMMALNHLHIDTNPEGPQPMELASEELQDDREVALLSIQKNPNSIQWLSYRLRDDEALAEMAMSLSPLAYPGLSQRLKLTPDYLRAYAQAVEQKSNYPLEALDCIPTELSKVLKDAEASLTLLAVNAWLLNKELSTSLESKSDKPRKGNLGKV